MLGLSKDTKKFGIILKSGKEIEVNCGNLVIKHISNELTSYEIIDGDDYLPFYIRISEIAAIVRK